MEMGSLVRYQAHPLRVQGAAIEAKLSGVRIGELCEIRHSWNDDRVIARAQVLGFRDDVTILSLIGSVHGLSRDMVLSPTGKAFVIRVSPDLAGSVMTSAGEITEQFAVREGHTAPGEERSVSAPPPRYDERRGIQEMFHTGVRAIDGLITCGLGQRMGIFASAGCGKTTLMQMIINNAEADLFVVALIGERGREVTEFIEELRTSGRADKCIVVYATSDFSALDRMNAASIAMTVAEYFRDLGQNVVLFLDSITRYARAVRDVALLAGEPPARRGYPASVFERLPALLERPGATHSGSITAFLTILLESEDESDPVAEEIRSILDGHILLSRKLAAKNHYPAIDVLKSVSRISTRVTTSEHQALSAGCRQLLAKTEELEVLINFGEYQQGANAVNDKACEMMPRLEAFLCQPVNSTQAVSQTLEQMHELRL